LKYDYHTDESTCNDCPTGFNPIKGIFGENTCIGSCDDGLIFDNDSEDCVCPAYYSGAVMNSD